LGKAVYMRFAPGTQAKPEAEMKIFRDRKNLNFRQDY